MELVQGVPHPEVAPRTWERCAQLLPWDLEWPEVLLG